MVFSLHRIFAVYRRHLGQLVTDPGRLLATFYWPLLDVIVWGFAAFSFQGNQPQNTVTTSTFIACAVIWQIVVRSALEVSICMLEEVWSHNVTNLFASPLAISEWIGAVVALAFTLAMSVVICCATLAWILYSVNLFALWYMLLPTALLLFLAGVWIGFISSGLYIGSGGKKGIEQLTWIFGWSFVMFSGAFYDLSVMPRPFQVIASMLPLKYIFTGLKEMLNTNTIPWTYYGIGLALSCMYITCALTFFIKMFDYARSQGLAKLDQ